MYKIGIIGTGYVGLVTGSCLADFGLNVSCFDTDTNKINALNEGIIPIYEPQLDMIVQRNKATGRLRFIGDISELVSDSEVIFIAVGTPQASDGSADLSYVQSAARNVAKHIDSDKIIVSKSTVPIGTAKKIESWMLEELAKRDVSYRIDVIANPEFLREGSAVYDFMHPDRVVLGYTNPEALAIMKGVYRVLYLNETPFIETDYETAETIKYASNAFLALKITYINQIANLCEAVGANVLDVAKAMGKDGRIGSKFLHPGPGFGGSCFPKDTNALAQIGRKYGSPVSLIEETIKINEAQKKRMVAKIVRSMGDVNGKTFAVLGLAFKPNTDDMRDAPSVTILNELFDNGASFRVFDPAASGYAADCFSHMSNKILFCNGEYETLENSDALLILTEWNQFRNLDLWKIKTTMRGEHFFDFRNIYRRKDVENTGLRYIGVGT